jgi:hypothetical protein
MAPDSRQQDWCHAVSITSNAVSVHRAIIPKTHDYREEPRTDSVEIAGSIQIIVFVALVLDRCSGNHLGTYSEACGPAKAYYHCTSDADKQLPHHGRAHGIEALLQHDGASCLMSKNLEMPLE